VSGAALLASEFPNEWCWRVGKRGGDGRTIDAIEARAELVAALGLLGGSEVGEEEEHEVDEMGVLSKRERAVVFIPRVVIERSMFEDEEVQTRTGIIMCDDEEDLARATTASATQSPGDSVEVRLTHEVAYSTAFRVPLLLFRASAVLPGGMVHPLTTAEECHAILSACSAADGGAVPIVTQFEHPLDGLPWWALHPCHTADWMTLVASAKQRPRDYLASWLSIVGPRVGLNVPLALHARD
jgi:ubiquitin-like-conjugating enzyme ATG10